jgi:hypothetical protein
MSENYAEKAFHACEMSKKGVLYARGTEKAFHACETLPFA